MTEISQAAVDLIIAAEVSSRKYYEKNYQRPEWPGGLSGITIAIGYDVGYATPAKLRADWTGRISKDMIDALVPCCGVHGDAAKRLLAGVKNRVVVPWAMAIEVFDEIDRPAWIALVCKTIPGAAKLPPDCLGAVVSCAYNRGASFKNEGARYAEMRAIRAAVIANKLDAVPAYFVGMKRLWPNQRGLRDRREAEARLWRAGLIAGTSIKIPPVVPPPIIHEEPPPMVPTPTNSVPETSGAGAVVVATAGAAVGRSAVTVAIICVIGFCIAIAVTFGIRAYRSRIVTAREKDIPLPPTPAGTP